MCIYIYTCTRYSADNSLLTVLNDLKIRAKLSNLYIYTCMYVYTRMYVHVYIHMCVYSYIYTVYIYFFCSSPKECLPCRC